MAEERPTNKLDGESYGSRPTEHNDQWGNKAPVDPVTQQYVKKGETSAEPSGNINELRQEFEAKKKKVETIKLHSGIKLKKQNFLGAFGTNDKEAEYQAHKAEPYADYDYLNDQGIFTLRNFKQHREEEIRKRKQWLTPDEEEIMYDPELLEKVEKTLRESSMCCRIDFNYIEDVLQTELKNQFYWYKAHTGGCPSPTGRAEASHKMFGTEIGGSSGSRFDSNREWGRSFEKYGSLLSNDLIDRFGGDGTDAATGYGDSLIEFKPSIRRRTTYTLGDSLGSNCLPQLLGGRFDFFTAAHTWGDADADRLRNAQTTRQVSKALGADTYIELQYHGHVTAQDIGNITADWNRWGEPQGKRILEMCKALGIKCYSYKARYNADKTGLIRSVAEITLNDDGTLSLSNMQEREYKRKF